MASKILFKYGTPTIKDHLSFKYSCTLVRDQKIYLSDNFLLGAGGWGDPHFTSFDNKRYTFVAAGEYILFGVHVQGNEVFYVQGRLGSRGWRATTTTALAFGVPGVYGYQVHAYLLPVATLPKCNNISMD